jgi:hypothetical protein
VDFDRKFTLEAENDVQEVNGLRTKIAYLPCRRLDVLHLDAQRFHKRFRNPRIDFV